MARWRWLVSAALVAISSVATARAQQDNVNERVVSIDEIPAPAREAILSAVGGGLLMEVHEETWQRGGPVYERHIRQGRRETIIWVDAAGHVLHEH